MGNQEGKLKKQSEFMNNYQNNQGNQLNYCNSNTDDERNKYLNINDNNQIENNKNFNINYDNTHKANANENIEDINNQNFVIKNSSIQNQQSNVNQNAYTPYLNKAYQLFIEASNLIKQFSFYEALFKLEESQKITTNIYYKIVDDEMLKNKVDYFLKNIACQIDFVNFQIKNQYEFKDKAGFASKETDKKKIDYLECLRKNNIEQSNSNSLIITEKSNDNQKPTLDNPINQKYIPKNISDSNKLPNTSLKDQDSKIVTCDLKNRILSEIVDTKPGIKFSDVIGLDDAKQILREIIVLPNLRPDLFTGLRTPPRGLLLFGPPGVGKTMIAKAVATECKCTFFNISASSLTSKYLGESEKLVRALFELAYEKQPSVVFIDELESILSKRSEGENDATKRLKTEFLVQFDGVGSDQSAKILIIGATNRPEELDSAVLRRLPKRVYISPFDKVERSEFLKFLMKNTEHKINDEEFNQIAVMTNYYSNSDLKELCREAAYEAVREINDFSEINNVQKLRACNYNDFLKALKKVRGILNENMLKELLNWNEKYGAIN